MLLDRPRDRKTRPSTRSDRQLVEQMIDAHELLIDQAWGLISYVEDRNDTEDWFRYRRQSWEAIRELLDLE